MATEQSIPGQVILKRADGRSLLDAKGPVTSANVNEYAVPAEHIKAVADQLQGLGFKVETHDAYTMSISGSPRLYERVFGLIYGADQPAHAARIPDGLAGWVADVIVTPPPELF